MQIIVIGCGKVGSGLARILSDEGHDVVIVDNDSNNFKSLGGGFNGVTVTGVPIDQDVLKQAGIETAYALAAVTPDDNINVMACQVAKEIFKVPRVIARIYNPAREHVFHEFGLETICPTNMTADVIRSIVLGEENSCHHIIGSNVFSFKYKKIPKGYQGKRVTSIKLKAGTAIFGIVQKGRFIFANPGIKLADDDILVISEMVD
ncbi:trk system potassium uptake protein TrkA [Anaerobacterium chartisolvens]|uniref:Trk system potassium uptake protein TrkA n=1 Tax=Anaerobacterium chartisolvens TaxID=1297424 RepID=A0A369AZL5_9FIRM|nr:TrkA family potassium uptake protein [Anaerobacterium chartisolvens]RCX13778.1 trk system potassium uptake protein TrkA [Anaerobacterium chartisolvens]